MLEYKASAPIYLQIINAIRQRIASGGYAPGERVNAVRDLAVEFSVNPNTMQRALSELEREGLMFSERTSGRFITSDGELIKKTKQKLAVETVDDFFEKMHLLGFGKSEILNLIELREEYK